MSSDYTAAWVSEEDVQRDWDAAERAAVHWVEGQADRLGVQSLLVTNAFDSHLPSSALSHYVRGRTYTTPRSGWNGPRGLAVLSYAPTPEALDFAARIARGGALCVVEGFLTPMRGWAAEVSALDLTTKEPTTADPRLQRFVDRLVFYGNNGYGPDFDRKMAGHVLDDLAAEALLDKAAVLGALAARQISPRAQKRLGQMIDVRLRGNSAL